MEKGFLPPGINNADQGSDLNLISYSLLTAMKYKPISLKKGFSGLSMGTADGNHSQLNSYTVFDYFPMWYAQAMANMNLSVHSS
jgi:hypothetical protein